jgi:hypothetical protein
MQKGTTNSNSEARPGCDGSITLATTSALRLLQLLYYSTSGFAVIWRSVPFLGMHNVFSNVIIGGKAQDGARAANMTTMELRQIQLQLEHQHCPLQF